MVNFKNKESFLSYSDIKLVINLAESEIFSKERSFNGKVNLKTGQSRIFFDRLSFPLCILLLAVIGAKLIGPYGGLQIDK